MTLRQRQPLFEEQRSQSTPLVAFAIMGILFLFLMSARWISPRVLISFADTNDPVIGNEQGAVTLRVFLDLVQPESQEIISLLRKIEPRTVRVLVNFVPRMDQSWSLDTAKASWCAHQQGFFWEYIKALNDSMHVLRALDWQADQLATVYKQFASRSGNVRMEEFQSCIESRETLLAIEDQKAEAKALHIEDVPAMYWDNTYLSTLEQLEKKLAQQ